MLCGDIYDKYLSHAPIIWLRRKLSINGTLNSAKGRKAAVVSRYFHVKGMKTFKLEELTIKLRLSPGYKMHNFNWQTPSMSWK